MFLPRAICALIILVFALLSSINAVRSFPNEAHIELGRYLQFSEAPEYQNEPKCAVVLAGKSKLFACDPSLVHIATTIDLEYFKGFVAAVHLVLKHASCPENVFFHFISFDIGLVTLQKKMALGHLQLATWMGVIHVANRSPRVSCDVGTAWQILVLQNVHFAT